MKFLEELKKHYVTIMFFVGIIWTVFSFYQKSIDNNEEIMSALQTTQQMSLKSVIWNEAIPVGERASACDTYLDAGYNSLTKKECEVIIEIAEEEGIFKT